MRERLGGWEGRKVVFLGDGDCNVARSWMWAAARLGFELVIAAPKEFQPPTDFISSLEAPQVICEADAAVAVEAVLLKAGD